jgi:hypothetical protein
MRADFAKSFAVPLFDVMHFVSIKQIRMGKNILAGMGKIKTKTAI